MKKLITHLLASITLLPVFLLDSNVLAQERNFKSSCSYAGTSGVEYTYGKRGKCIIKTYVSGDYLIVEVKSSWEEEKRIMRLENKPNCSEWRDLSESQYQYSSNVCHGQYWHGDSLGWGYIVAVKDKNSFGYSLGNAYMFSYDGPLLQPSSSTDPSSEQANSDSNQICSTAIDRVAKQIHKYGTSVNVSAYNSANDGYTGNPSNREGIIVFTLGNLMYGENMDIFLSLTNRSPKSNSVAENILNSWQLQQNWANYLVTNCNNIAVVSFGQANTGWNNQFAIQANGFTKGRDCLDNPMVSDRFLPWNYKSCD